MSIRTQLNKKTGFAHSNSARKHFVYGVNSSTDDKVGIKRGSTSTERVRTPFALLPILAIISLLVVFFVTGVPHSIDNAQAATLSGYDPSQIGEPLGSGAYKQCFAYGCDEVLLIPKEPGSLTSGQLENEAGMLDKLKANGFPVVDMETGTIPGTNIPAAIAGPRGIVHTRDEVYDNPQALSKLFGDNLDSALEAARAVRPLFRQKNLICMDVQAVFSCDSSGNIDFRLTDPGYVKRSPRLTDQQLTDMENSYDNNILNPLLNAQKCRSNSNPFSLLPTNYFPNPGGYSTPDLSGYSQTPPTTNSNLINDMRRLLWPLYGRGSAPTDEQFADMDVLNSGKPLTSPRNVPGIGHTIPPFPLTPEALPVLVP